MCVRMVHVRHMRMRVLQALMAMCMRVGFPGRIIRTVFVLVMCIMNVRMRVLHRLVNMLVLVLLSQMQPDADRHHASCGDQLKAQRLAQEKRREHEHVVEAVPAAPHAPPDPDRIRAAEDGGHGCTLSVKYLKILPATGAALSPPMPRSK